jgi:hypothetical protein
VLGALRCWPKLAKKRWHEVLSERLLTDQVGALTCCMTDCHSVWRHLCMTLSSFVLGCAKQRREQSCTDANLSTEQEAGEQVLLQRH